MLMLNDDPEFRPTAKQALKHPWFNLDSSVIDNLLVQNRQALSFKDSARCGDLKPILANQVNAHI